MDKYPLTIRLDDDLKKVVKAQASLTRSSLGSVVVDAARQALMPEYQQKQEQMLLKAMDRCFNRLVKMHEDQQTQHELVREMLAMFVRSFFRRIPPIKPEPTDAMRRKSARDFEMFLDILATNRRNRVSVMDTPPPQESNASAKKETANGEASLNEHAPKIPPTNSGSLFGG